MAFAGQDRDRARRIEGKQDEILRRWTAAEKRWEEGEAERVREFEALEGRAMTRQEKIDASFEGLLRKMNVMTLEHLEILNDLRIDMQHSREEADRASARFWKKAEAEYSENRAEAQAGREALLRILDRLPPPKDPPHGPS
jgi:hypothetical protein